MLFLKRFPFFSHSKKSTVPAFFNRAISVRASGRTFPKEIDVKSHWRIIDEERGFRNLNDEEKAWTIIKELVLELKSVKKTEIKTEKFNDLFEKLLAQSSSNWISNIFDFFPESKNILSVSKNHIKVSNKFLNMPKESINRELLKMAGYEWDPESVERKVYKSYPKDLAQKIEGQLKFGNSRKETVCSAQATKELLGIIEEFKISPDVFKKGLALSDSIIKIIEKNRPEHEVFLTGSFKNGTALKFSDIDLKISSPQKYSKNTRWLSSLPAQLSQLGLFDFTVLNSRTQRVPLVKCRDRELNLDVDIVCKNDHSDKTTDLFRAYSLLHPVIQNLFLLVKLWAHSRRINEAVCGSMNSSSILASVITYLISTGIVPNLQSVCKDHEFFVSKSTKSKPLERYSHRTKVCSVCKGRLHTNPSELKWYFNSKIKLQLDPSCFNEYTLLLGYFQFMTQTYKPAQYALSMQAGSLVSLERLMFLTKDSFVITDPFDLDDNFARATHSLSTNAILWEMRRAEHLLQTSNMMEAFSEYIEIPLSMYKIAGIYPSKTAK